MLVVGAKGLAKEVLEVLLYNQEVENLVFYDDINTDEPDMLFGKFPILRTPEAAKAYFETIDPHFTLGVGFPHVRYPLFHKFLQLGGTPRSVIANNSYISHYEIELGKAVTISFRCEISNSVSIGQGSFVNVKTVIGHDTKIGEFCEICPSVNLAGHIEVGNYSYIGTGAIIYPKVKIGENVSITAGSVVRKSVPDNAIVHGFPSKIIGKKPVFKKI